MNLVDELLKADSKSANQLNTGVFESARLATILGKDKPVAVEIREIVFRRVEEIMSSQMDRKGRVDYGKTFDAKLTAIVEGCVNPQLRSKELQEHFNCPTAKDLAEKLFGNEVTALSEAIVGLSGLGANNGEDLEDEVKN